MLARGRERLTDEGLVGNIHYVKADAEALPFREQYFDCVCISFGLRNVTRIDKALQSMFRALKPGGQVLILEFSHVTLPMLEKVYDLYSFSVLPRLGRWVTGDEDSYRYLVESIRKHPPQDKLQQMMEQEGFDRVRCFNLSGGIAAVHRGNKF
ncbi:MAG: ubiquinone/menaquinone biosynthesis methyltransferase, partial [Gammaproteobacteria bacterium]|nr:ubiquinone/menaquinone biosynthesis methyltransferase [Gammaproteobacteria bacterium]